MWTVYTGLRRHDFCQFRCGHWELCEEAGEGGKALLLWRSRNWQFSKWNLRFSFLFLLNLTCSIKCTFLIRTLDCFWFCWRGEFSISWDQPGLEHSPVTPSVVMQPDGLSLWLEWARSSVPPECLGRSSGIVMPPALLPRQCVWAQLQLSALPSLWSLALLWRPALVVGETVWRPGAERARAWAQSRGRLNRASGAPHGLLGLSVRASLAHEGAFLPGAVLPSSGFSVLSEGRGEFLGVTSLRCPRGAVPSSAGSSGSLCLGRVPPLDPPWSQPALRPQPEGPHQHGRPFGKLRWINCTGLRCCF